MALNDASNQGWTIQAQQGSQASVNGAITATTAGATSIVFTAGASATAQIQPNAKVTLTGGASSEQVTVTSGWTPGSSATVPITGTVANANQNLARFSVPVPSYVYADTASTAFLSAELPNSTTQSTWGATQAVWQAASGNPANVPSIASKTLAAPTITCAIADTSCVPGQWIIYANPSVVGGYPPPTVSYAWGDGNTDVRNEAPYVMEHRYAADGAYTLTVTVASTQGTANTSRTVTITNGTAVFT